MGLYTFIFCKLSLFLFYYHAFFQIYFFMLREENDIDQGLAGNSLFDQIEGLEKAQIEVCIRYYDENRMDSTALKERLAELIEMEKLKEVENKTTQEQTS